MNIVEKLASEGHLDDKQVERIGRNVRDFLAELDRDPALCKEAMEKLAGPSNFLGTAYEHAKTIAPYAVGSAALGALMGGAVDVGKSAVRSVQDSVNKRRAFSSMMEENPHLSEADPKLMEKAFNTLYRFNPAYAQDPLVAGTFVKNVVDQERMDIGSVSNLVSAHKQMSDGRRGGGGAEFFSGFIPKGIEAGHSVRSARMKEEQQARELENMPTQEMEHALHNERLEAEKAKGNFWRSAEGVSENDPRVK